MEIIRWCPESCLIVPPTKTLADDSQAKPYIRIRVDHLNDNLWCAKSFL